MSVKIHANLDFASGAKLVNLPDATAPQEAVTLAQLNAAVEGLNWKDSVRVASTANINLSSPGSSIDGISLSSGDRFLAKDQSTGSQNGIYVWNGAASAATRALDASTFAELEGAVVVVEEGTANGGTSWRQTQVNGTIDSSTVTFTAFGTAAPAASESTPGVAELATQGETDAGTDDARIVTPLKLKTASFLVRKYTTTVGDGSATQFTITHNLGSRVAMIQVYRTASPYDTIFCDVERTSTTTATVRFATPPSSGEYTVVVLV
jgi:hypothetical protein